MVQITNIDKGGRGQKVGKQCIAVLPPTINPKLSPVEVFVLYPIRIAQGEEFKGGKTKINVKE